MINTKPVKRQISDLNKLARTLSATLKGIEGAMASSPGEEMPEAARLMIDAMAARATDLLASAKAIEASAKQLQKNSSPATSAAAD